MFFAYRNKAIIGYDIEMVAFESKKKRDEFARFEGFKPISCKEVAKANSKLVEECRRYPTTIFGEDLRLRGIAMWYLNGAYAGIE